MNTRSLRFRLSFWYICTVAIICVLAACGYWFAIRSDLNHALDQGLRYRLIGLRQFLEDGESADSGALASRLREIEPLAELFQVFDAKGNLIAQSRALARRGIAERPPPGLGFEVQYGPGGRPDFEMRVAWQRVRIDTRSLILGVDEPQRKFEGVLADFTNVLLLSTPLVLVLAMVAGVWIGHRALRPLAQIAKETRAITESNLSVRIAVPDSRDEVQQLSETLNDMLARLERSFTRTRQFTADASHELRAPMTLIYTAAQFSLRRECSREDLMDGMQKILRESQRTTALIDDLLLLARGDAGMETCGLEKLNAAPLLRDAADRASGMAAPKRIAVTLQLNNDVLPVKADEKQLRQLLLILIDNALKYSPPGACVTVTGGVDATGVIISVADTGSGISPGDLPHIFERFWRADKVRSREAGGTGLGLTIAKQIADRHGASITVESVPGRGSVFTIRLPPV